LADIALPCRWRDGRVTDTELLGLADPADWTADEARDVAWAIQRTLDAHAVSAMVIVEVAPMQTWRIAITADTGTAATRGLRLSSEAVTWFERVAFTLLGPHVH
jgi:hypothetical protein